MHCKWELVAQRFICANCHRPYKGKRTTPPVRVCDAPGRASAPSARVKHGVGHELTRILWRLRIRSRPGCPCRRRARMMDDYGPDWCENNMDLIVTWLAEEAGRRGLPFLPLAAARLVRRAIRTARRQAASSNLQSPIPNPQSPP